ncbi:MAG: DUF6438 domain-containing protein [Saprospiraceae bacterium]|nr:DUF6438 domain-containing protein [Saprospiraceae bacterium]
MKNLFFIASICFLVLGCSNKTSQTTTQAVPPPPPPPTPTLGDAPPPPKPTTKSVGIPKDIDPDLVASLRRSPCFGRCPAYTYELFADGKVAYFGESHVQRLGSYTTKVDAAFMKRVADKALSIKYLALSEKYPIGDVAISDVPTVTTYIRIGNDGKKVANNYDAPKELTAFEEWLDVEFDGLKWEAAEH